MQKLFSVTGLIAGLFFVAAAALVRLISAAAIIFIAAAVFVVLVAAAALVVIIQIVDVLEIYRDSKILFENALKDDLSGNKSTNHGGDHYERAPKTFTRAVFLFHLHVKNYLLSFLLF